MQDSHTVKLKIQPEQVLKEIQNSGFITIDNCINLNSLSEMQNFWIDHFSEKNKKAFSSSNIYSYWQTLGDLNYSSSRNDKSVYLLRNRQYLWNKPINELTTLFSNQLNEYRNLMLGLPKEFGFMFSESEEANFTQVNCYPDGGHLLEHRDSNRQEVLIDCFFNLTFKGTHFEEGGLYIKINDKKIYLDDLAKPGSVIFFNGNLLHGVDEISSKSNIGRIAVYPHRQYFFREPLPNYRKFLKQALVSIRKKIFKLPPPNQGNSAFVK